MTEECNLKVNKGIDTICMSCKQAFVEVPIGEGYEYSNRKVVPEKYNLKSHGYCSIPCTMKSLYIHTEHLTPEFYQLMADLWAEK